MDNISYRTYKTICKELQKSEEIDVVEVIETLASSLIHVLGKGKEDEQISKLFFDDIKDKLKRYSNDGSK